MAEKPENKVFDHIRAKILRQGELAEFRKRNASRKIVFCSGCYDILQSGHAVFFSQCKDFGDLLVVGVGRDSVISRLKGPERPINPENNRLYLVAALQDVDFAILNETDCGTGKIDFAHILEELRPDVFILNDDDSGIAAKRALCERVQADLQLVSRVVPPELEATSTTRIINKINFSYKAPLRIDFAGGWTDVPHIMEGRSGYVANIAIKPHIEYADGKYNFSGYPRGSGLSTSTAAKTLEMISARDYEIDSKQLADIAEDVFRLENRELNWAIGRQDQYSIIFGGYNCLEYHADGIRQVGSSVTKDILECFRPHLLLLHSGVSRNAQVAVGQVYKNYGLPTGREALRLIGQCALDFNEALQQSDFSLCAKIMEKNFEYQKRLAPASSNADLDKMYLFAKQNGAWGGKICGAGGGGSFIFVCDNPKELTTKMKKEFVECFEIDFQFEYANIRELNHIRWS